MNPLSAAMDEEAIAASLQAMGLLEPGATLRLTALGGGVSCDVWRAEAGRRTMCVKRALPRLRVAVEWLAPAGRAASEAMWFRLVGTFMAGCVPRVLGEDHPRHVFAMEYLPPQTHPVWKAQLASGDIDVAFAGTVGASLARIHAHTANRADIADKFANGAQFHALRLEPYLLFTADKHLEVADVIRDIADNIAGSRIALMHGDVSPKNILHGPVGPVFLDAETTCIGDPAFDLAFCLNHLLLKCIWHPQWAGAYLESFAALSSSYLLGVDWEDASALESRAARLLPALLLARVDGKSPVEYLTRAPDRNFVRETAMAFLQDGNEHLDALTARWRAAVQSRGG